MIKFRCPHCDQKIRVKTKYSGRQAKCPKCKLGLEVPSAIGGILSQYDELQEDEDAGGSRISLIDSGVFKGSSGDSSIFGAVEVGGETKECPKCSHTMGRQAMVCVQCGFSFAKGKRLKTQREVTAPTATAAAPSKGKLIAIVAAVVLAVVAVSGGILYALISLLESGTGG